MKVDSDIKIDKRKYVIKDREAYSKIRSKNATGRKKVEVYKERDTVNKTIKFPESIVTRVNAHAQAQETSFNRIVVNIVETELFSGGKLEIVPKTKGAEPTEQKTVTFKTVMYDKLKEFSESIGETPSRIIISMLEKNL